MNLEKINLESLRFESLAIDARMSSTILMLICDVIFSGLLLLGTYGEIRLQAAERKAGTISADTLGSCHISCLMNGKTFDPNGVKCLPDLTFAHCNGLEKEEASLYCPNNSAKSKLVSKFSTRPCN